MKTYLTIGLFLLLLSGCSSNPQDDATLSSSSVEALKDSVLSDLSSDKEQKIITATYEQTSDTSQITQTVSYQNGRLLTLSIDFVSFLDEETRTQLASLSPEEAQASLTDSLSTDADYLATQGLKGVTVTPRWTDDMHFCLHFDIDVQQADLTKLSQTNYFDTSFASLKEAVPEIYLHSLEQNGFTKISSSDQ